MVHLLTNTITKSDLFYMKARAATGNSTFLFLRHFLEQIDNAISQSHEGLFPQLGITVMKEKNYRQDEQISDLRHLSIVLDRYNSKTSLLILITHVLTNTIFQQKKNLSERNFTLSISVS